MDWSLFWTLALQGTIGGVLLLAMICISIMAIKSAWEAK